MGMEPEVDISGLGEVVEGYFVLEGGRSAIVVGEGRGEDMGKRGSLSLSVLPHEFVVIRGRENNVGSSMDSKIV